MHTRVSSCSRYWSRLFNAATSSRRNTCWKVREAFLRQLRLLTVLVITQVFPDEFHLHTLDQFLSATARLNPHVNIKAIVIGMMDRLSAYAARESESMSPEARKEMEVEATAKLLERLKVAKEAQPSGEATPAQENGDTENGESAPEASGEPPAEATSPKRTQDEDSPQANGDSKQSRGIPDNIRLFEVFHEQVMTLVNMQRLPIQDVTALLVSLMNLAL